MRWVAAVVVLALVAGGVWAWTHQTTLSALLPQTQLNALLSRADKAYAAGNLSGGPDSARDLYEAARALDPDNEQALAGLQHVGHAELRRAKAALQRHDYMAARSALEEARSLLGGGADVAAIDQALAKAVLHTANIDVLLDQARAALANGNIDGNDGAATLFGKVLAGDPHNPVARHGMDQIGDLLASRIQTRLGDGDRTGARQTLADLSSLLPGYSQLPDLRASIAAADRAADAQRDQYLAQGQADLRAGKITGAGTDNAEAQFKAALAADPGNAGAQAGLGQVAGALIMQANAAIDAGRVHDAKNLLDQAAALAPKSTELAAARSRLAAHGNSQVAAASSARSPLTPAESARLARLLARAKVAARKGDIMLPPGNSAYDLYRTALGIDGNNAEAQAGLRDLPGITRDQFKRALHDGSLERAHDMLATLDQLDPGDPAETGMRHQLGSAWLDRADHEAMLGRNAAARSALEEARQLVPQDPRISEVRARIRHDN
jgi:tetratricopeptide (TPR) repeat protein